MNLDLVVLVPDRDIEQALRGLFSRPAAIEIQPLARVEILTHPQHDPGVFNTGSELLAPYVRDSRHALVVLDKDWSGAPSSADELEAELEQKLRHAWGERARVVCIDPEVEAWVWSDSRQVADTLGWSGMGELKAWLIESGAWREGRSKPDDPKSAFRNALRARQRSPSSSIFRILGQSVSMRRCEDRAFLRLLGVLRSWFPPRERTA